MIVEKTFDKEAFLLEIREELKYLGMKLSELAIKAKIPQKRFDCILSNKLHFKTEEIERITMVLGLN